jgi:pimeloyl-ACP methyl ester carboxylesterase
LQSYYMALFQLPYLPEWVLGSRRADGLLRRAGMSPDLVKQFHRDIVDHSSLRGGLGYYRSLLRVSPGQLGRKVTVPTTYVWSDRDVALGRKGAELTERWVTGPYELEVYQGASHWIPDERPAELAASIVRRIGI